MPSNYFCASCKLGFAVGLFHYHEVTDGYWAGTLLVCSACGTMHSVEQPAAVRAPILGGLFFRKGVPEKLDRLIAQSGPCYLESAGNNVMLSLKSWEECKISHILRPPGKHSYMKDFLDLGPANCNHCGRSATLVRDWGDFNVRCPACGKPSVKMTESWIT
jgi:predicted Zn-ribbon and HTH transcriptional regulator